VGNRGENLSEEREKEEEKEGVRHHFSATLLQNDPNKFREGLLSSTPLDKGK